MVENNLAQHPISQTLKGCRLGGRPRYEGALDCPNFITDNKTDIIVQSLLHHTVEFLGKSLTQTNQTKQKFI